MNETYQLSLNVPSSDNPLIEYGRHFIVSGTILHKGEVPCDAILSVELLGACGNVLRHAVQERKDCDSLYLYHPDLVAYRESLDPGREGIKKFGFPELLVKGTSSLDESFRNAVIKCWYSESAFKALIVSATDRAHGAVLDDGIGFVDENGDAYTVLPMGKYTVRVRLLCKSGELLALAEKQITIGKRRDQLICRFNPVAHRKRMTAWSAEMGIPMMNDPLPGYLDPYLGKWLYHMGLLPLYRACDAALYDGPRIHMFLYLIDPTSTSYETELAFLQTKGCIDDSEKFVAYRYDIGEAVLDEGGSKERHARIVPFEEGEYLALYRIDAVNERARENVYHLNGEGVISYHTDPSVVEVCAGGNIAFSGVVRPWQMDKKHFALRKDNTYAIGNAVDTIRYAFYDGIEERVEHRRLLLERIEGESIGFSVFEFYNIFHVEESWKGRDILVEITACDKYGEGPNDKKEITLRVL